jgi:hypothetical protein
VAGQAGGGRAGRRRLASPDPSSRQTRRSRGWPGMRPAARPRPPSRRALSPRRRSRTRHARPTDRRADGRTGSTPSIAGAHCRGACLPIVANSTGSTARQTGSLGSHRHGLSRRRPAPAAARFRSAGCSCPGDRGMADAPLRAAHARGTPGAGQLRLESSACTPCVTELRAPGLRPTTNQAPTRPDTTGDRGDPARRGRPPDQQSPTPCSSPASRERP